MRREDHDTHAAHRDAQHKQAQGYAHEEPLKRAYERVVNGEEPVDAAVDDTLLPDELPIEAAAPAAIAEPRPKAADVDAAVAQELAATSGSSPAKYGSLKGKDHNV